MKQYVNAKIFTGKGWIENAIVNVKDGLIEEVGSFQPGSEVIDCEGGLLVPALIDLQLYGAGGKLFSAYPSVDSLEILSAENKKAGVVTCLPTIATQPIDIIHQCIAAIKNYWENGGDGIAGMHLEGPFLNASKRGAHLAEWIHSPTEAEVNSLLEAGKDVIKIITVAPECCDPRFIKMFIDAGIIVSAGHSNAGYEQAREFSSMGVKLVTHMFNAMSPLHHRDTGLPGAAFEDKNLMSSIIPDGIHVSYSALKIAKREMGDRLFFITDSVTETNIGPYQHTLNIDHFCTSDGTLSGSAITMLQGVRNAVRHAGFSIEEALSMATMYPAKAIGIDDKYGSIAPGKKASMLLINEQLEVVKNFI